MTTANGTGARILSWSRFTLHFRHDLGDIDLSGCWRRPFNGGPFSSSEGAAGWAGCDQDNDRFPVSSYPQSLFR
jgi:hypothetical protein